MRSPRFTIIVPAYNGGDFLKQCVRSILASTHADFELIVLDDASSDGSLEWLQQQRDKRLRIYPSDQRLGIVGNWRRSLEVPAGEFMGILGQDDLIDPNYLTMMDDLISRFPAATLYHAHFRFIDNESKLLRHCRPLPSTETAAQYLSALFSGERDTHGAGYMWRTELYKKIGGVPPYPGLLFADDALWISLMHPAYKAVAEAECFSIRRHQTSAGAAPNWRTWLGGMREYIPFLQSIAKADPEFERAYESHAPEYFLQWSCNIYKLALMQATQQNQKVSPHEVFKEIWEVLAHSAPSIAEKFEQLWKSSKGLRMREQINAYSITRRIYNAHLKIRLHE